MDTIRWPAGEGSWGQSSLQGRALRGDQAFRGGQLGGNRLAGEQLDINQAGMGVVRGRSGWQAEAVRGNQEGRQVSSWEPAVLDCERDIGNEQSDIPQGVPDWRGCRLG